MNSWIVSCALAEGLGMAAAAAAARGSEGMPAAIVVLLAVLAGLVEAAGIAMATFLSLRREVPHLSGPGWVGLTAVVGAAAWAVGSLPGALAGPGAGAGIDSTPSLWLVLPGAAGIGAATGALLGAAQATLLRGQAPHPARWVLISAAAWPVPMAVIFAGATTAGRDWPIAVVIAYGLLTGLVAGALLGIGYGALARTLKRPTTSLWSSWSRRFSSSRPGLRSVPAAAVAHPVGRPRASRWNHGPGR